MQTCAFNLFLRIIGLFIATSMALAPWLISVNINDPFLNQTWLVFGLAVLCIVVFAALRLFRQPRKSQIPLLMPGFLLWLAIAVSTIHSSYLVALRTGLLWGSLLAIFFMLRITLSKRDAPALLALISFSGLAMAVYTCFQACGYDIFTWPGSPYKVVGTLSNPQYLAAFLTTTALVTIGLAIDSQSWSLSNRITFAISTAIQILAIYTTDIRSCWATLAVGLVLYATSSWEIRPGRFLRSSPFVGGAIITFLLVLFYGSIAIGVDSYHWETLKVPPLEYISTVTRLFEWTMGFKLYLHFPLLGIGPGSSPYSLSSLRPKVGTVFGLSTFNDDVHSWPLQCMDELGIIGLLAICSLLAAVFGIHARKKYHALWEEAEDNENLSQQNFALVRAAIVPTTGLLVYGFFNPLLSVTPLVISGILLLALHQSLCQRDVRLRKSFSWLGIIYFLLVPLYAGAAWFCQSAHQEVEQNLFSGVLSLQTANYEAAENAFKGALNLNPQSLYALWGLAITFEHTGRLPQAMDVLARLDRLSPNSFAAKYHLARLAFDRRLVIEAHRLALKYIAQDTNPSGYELLGRILLAEGRPSEAAEIFREGLRFVPFWQAFELKAATQIIMQLAAIEMETGNCASAAALLAQLPQDVANTYPAMYLKGLNLYKSGNATDALSAFEKALTAGGASDPKLLNAVGFLLGETGGDLERAEKLLEEAYTLFKAKQPPLLSEVLEVAHSLGMTAWRKGNLSRAKELLKIAAEESPPEWGDITQKRCEDWNNFQEQAVLGKPLIPSSSASCSRSP